MGAVDVEKFLTYLAVERNVATSTQNQAFSAILFLYKEVLKRPLETSFQFIGAKKPKRLPTERESNHKIISTVSSSIPNKTGRGNPSLQAQNPTAFKPSPFQFFPV
jgi:hypothetical protein